MSSSRDQFPPAQILPPTGFARGTGANTWLQQGELPLEAENGILTAEDVTGMDLLDTQLVVLSACNTGLGDIQSREGVFGLRRCFLLAGTKTLIMSLWKVPDRETRELMADFYQRVLAGESRGQALRQAQLAMKDRFPHDPSYWGAFICQGDPAPLVLKFAEFNDSWTPEQTGAACPSPVPDPEVPAKPKRRQLREQE